MAKFKIDKNKVNAKTINRTIRIKQETFNKLMGDDVELRRQFIEANATLVKDLDI